MSIVVLGARGQVGRALCELLKKDAIGLGRETADLAKPQTLAKVLDQYNPSVVINAAAYTQVDKAEEDRALAFTVNAEAPGVIAEWCAKKNVPFIHYSTDYVFDGSGSVPWKEKDRTGPLNIYGKSKLTGEAAVEAVGGKYFILRTSLVFDAQGENFFNIMLRLAQKEEEIKVVNDQCSSPTYAPYLAAATLEALQSARQLSQFPGGVYHMCSNGAATRYEFAQAIFDKAQQNDMSLRVQRVTAVPSSYYPRPAQRPLNSRLDCSKLKAILGVALPAWQEGVAACMEKKVESFRHADPRT